MYPIMRIAVVALIFSGLVVADLEACHRKPVRRFLGAVVRLVRGR